VEWARGVGKPRIGACQPLVSRAHDGPAASPPDRRLIMVELTPAPCAPGCAPPFGLGLPAVMLAGCGSWLNPRHGPDEHAIAASILAQRGLHDVTSWAFRSRRATCSPAAKLDVGATR
jgi:hypothetical protein